MGGVNNYKKFLIIMCFLIGLIFSSPFVLSCTTDDDCAPAESCLYDLCLFTCAGEYRIAPSSGEFDCDEECPNNLDIDSYRFEGDCSGCDCDLSGCSCVVETSETVGDIWKGVCLALPGFTFSDEQTTDPLGLDACIIKNNDPLCSHKGLLCTDYCFDETTVVKFYLEGVSGGEDETKFAKIPCPTGDLCVDGRCVQPCHLRKSQGHCDDDIYPGNSSCSWCLSPIGSINTMDLTYDFPRPDGAAELDIGSYSSLGFGKACVDVNANDPFNCGACGIAFGTALPIDDRFCQPPTPFCVWDADDEESSCVGRSAEAAVAAAEYVSEFVGVNPQYYYTINSDEGTYAVEAGAAPFYTKSEIESNPAACSAGGGTLDTGEGCCGDNKLRSIGSVCEVDKFCDGSVWHLADKSMGEVFTDDAVIYPLASVIREGGNSYEYVKCVDSNYYNKYFLHMNPGGEAACDAEHMGVGSNQGGGLQSVGFFSYHCPEGEYEIDFGGGIKSDHVCRTTKPGAGMKGIISSALSASVVCGRSKTELSSDFYGFVNYGVDVADDRKGEAPDRLAFAPSSEYSGCPGQIGNAYTEGGTEVNFEYTLPCPGVYSVSPSHIDDTAITSFGTSSLGTDVDSWVTFICVDPFNHVYYVELVEWIANPFDYVKGDGTVMGFVNNHEYLCFTDYSMLKSDSIHTYLPEASRAKIGICCGDQGCNDILGTVSTGGIEYASGDFVNTSDQIIYCLENGSWGYDLDSPDLQGACGAAGLSATGNFCCVEDDDFDLKESYNDPGSSVGACFLSEPQYNNNFLTYNTTVYDNVFIHNGSFFGCGELGKIALVDDWPNPGTGGSSTNTGEALVKPADYCTLLNTSSNTSAGGSYCSYDNVWIDSLGDDFSHNSVVPGPLLQFFVETSGDPDLQSANCCRPSECWDSLVDACIPEQLGVDEYYFVNDEFVFKCLGGNWVNLIGGGKSSPDGCYIGYCPDDSQCLFDAFGDPNDNGNVSEGANPQCINDGQYLDDFVCTNGEWSTRTKLLASKLASLVDDNDNFVLMCGPSDEVLINEQNLGESNNFCVLNLDGQRILGTTLNQPLVGVNYTDFITALEQSFLLSYPDLGVSFESGCTENTKDFQKCVDNDFLKLYFDDDYQMVVFSDDDVDGLTPGLGAAICRVLPSWLQWLCPGPGVVEENLADLTLFNRVYAARAGSKEVFGIAEKLCDPLSLRKKDLFYFNYTGFSSADLSYLVSNIDADNATITVSQNNIFIDNPEYDAWAALTLLRNTEQE